MSIEQARMQLLASLKCQIQDARILDAISRVRRELFVSPEMYQYAYDDRPLSIGYDQTISQPLIVALMTQALELKSSDKVLELGTGSGYQTAILAELAKYIVSVERIPELAATAQNLLNALKYKNIEIHQTRDELGWPEESPYNAILVTAAAPRIPDELLEQMLIGGRMVIPVGTRWEQELLKVIRGKERNRIENLGGCRFVSLIGPGAWEAEK